MNDEIRLAVPVSKGLYKTIKGLATEARDIRKDVNIPTFFNFSGNIDQVTSIIFNRPEVKKAIRDVLEDARSVILESIVSDLEEQAARSEKNAFQLRRKIQEVKAEMEKLEYNKVKP